MSKNIVLVGFMGTGKSTVGRLLAERLDRPFIDMDTVIEEREGCDIPTLFAREGEPYFRRCERALAAELGGRESLIIACGGGIVLDPANLAALGSNGLVVCLTADEETILRRVAAEEHRPLLHGDKAERIRALLQQRTALYAAIPWRIDTARHTPEAVVDRILALSGAAG
jgi:shikimate kinase